MNFAWKAIVGMGLLLTWNIASAARGDWRQMTVGHFHLYSTLGDARTREVARQLQAFEKTVGEFLQSDDRLPDVPTIIYILDDGDFQRYGAGRPGLAGVFYERPYANVVTINGDLPFDVVKVAVFHEYTHFIQRNSTSRKMPPWYVEGYAELFSGFRLTKDQIYIGDLPAGVHIDMQRWIPLDRILQVKQSDPEYRNEQLAPQFYGESWALVHLLLFDDRSLQRPTTAYLDNLDAGVPEPEAFTQAYPFDKNALDSAVRRLISHRVINVKRKSYPEGLALDEAPILPLTAAQADAEIARMAMMIGWPKQTLGPLAASALKENRSDPAVRALCARIAARDGEPQDITDLTTRLAEGGIDYAQTRIDAAESLMTQSASKEAFAQAYAILFDLAHSDNPPLEAVSLWANAASRSDVDPIKLLTVLERNSVRAPHDTLMIRELALAHEAIGDKSKARADYERIMLVSDRPEERLWAQKQADSARLQ